MPKVDLYNMNGEVIGDIELAESVFGAEVNKDVLPRPAGSDDPRREPPRSAWSGLVYQWRTWYSLLISYRNERFSRFTVTRMLTYTASQMTAYPTAKIAVKIPSTAGSKGIHELTM